MVKRAVRPIELLTRSTEKRSDGVRSGIVLIVSTTLLFVVSHAVPPAQRFPQIRDAAHQVGSIIDGIYSRRAKLHSPHGIHCCPRP